MPEYCAGAGPLIYSPRKKPAYKQEIIYNTPLEQSVTGVPGKTKNVQMQKQALRTCRTLYKEKKNMNIYTILE